MVGGIMMVMNMTKDDIDKENYTIRVNRSNDYVDSFDEVVGAIADSREKNLISETEMSFLLNLALNKHMKDEMNSAVAEMLPKRESGFEKRTMFMHFNSCSVKHA
jgi:hypothetical protein